MVPENSIEDTGEKSENRNINQVLKLRLPVSVVIAEKEVKVEYVLDMGPGGIIQFDKSTDEMLEILVGGKKIGRGEVVKVGENFGVVIRKIRGVRERVEQLGSLQ